MIVTKTAVSMASTPKAKATLLSSRTTLVRLVKESAFATTNATMRMQRKQQQQQHFVTTTESALFVVDAVFRKHTNNSCFFKSSGSDRCFWSGLWKGRQRMETSFESNAAVRRTLVNNDQHPRDPFRRRHSRRSFSETSAFTTSIENSGSKNNKNNKTSKRDLSVADKTEGNVPASWKQMYDILVAYQKKHGSTIVPDRCSDDNKTPAEIGKWVKVQRKHSRFLSQQQKNLLNKLEFVWDHVEAQWLEKYERLCDYESNEMSANEISNIRSSDLESVFEKRYQKDPVLRRWVNAQRQKYRSETISVERFRLLENVEGFIWDVKDARWFEMHRRLKLFAKEHNGSCIVPQHYDADPQLACWVSNQRHRKHQLSAERINMLNALDFVWDVRECQWRGNYEKYEDMYFGGGSTTEPTESSHDNNGNTGKDDDDDDEEQRIMSKEQRQLIDWAIKQRRANRNGTLSANRKRLLDELVHPIDGSKFSWDPQAQNWMEMYDELLEYRKIHKHVMVPSSLSSNNRQLGVWVANQRRNFKNGTLSKKRKKRLDSIDFV